jgi:hypothetical protein
MFIVVCTTPQGQNQLMRHPQSMAFDAGPIVDLSAAAWYEWNCNVEGILRGVAHALNNRAAALSAVMELASDGDASAASILKSELQKVRDLSAVVRTIGTPRQGTEALAPREAAADALAVLGMHADQRQRVTLIEAANDAAVRAPRWMFVRALIALVSSIPVSGATPHSVRVTVVADDDWVTVRADAAGHDLAARSALTAELARAMGGEVLTDAYGFRLPSLAAVRRREGL